MLTKSAVRSASSKLVYRALAEVELARHAAKDQQREFRGCFGEDLRGVTERNFVTVGFSTVDIVKPDGVLRHHLEGAASGLEHFGVNLVAQGSDKSIDPGLNLLDDQTLRWRFELVVYRSEERRVGKECRCRWVRVV